MHNENMPSHEKIMQFSKILARETGREVLAEQKPSRVVLLGHDKADMKIRRT